MRRSHAIAGAATVAAAASLPRRARTEPLPKLLVLRANVESTMGPNYALATGLFEKYGLDVTVETSASGSAGTSAVLGGAAQIASSNVISLVVAHAKNIPISLFAPGAAYVPGRPNVGVMVAKSSPFRTAADLAGKTVAVEGLHDLGTLAVMAWMQRSGIDPTTVKFVEMPDSAKLAAVTRGTVDAAEMFTPFYEPALAECRTLTMPYAAIAESFLINGWFAQKDWLAANGDLAARFARAVTEAQAWANREHGKSATILAAFTKLDLATIDRMTRVTFAQRLDPALVQPIIKLAVQFGLIPATFPAAAMIAYTTT
jgi:NitT/TauT family transport system substrate-binding protein